jgi:hypothetical protein
LILQEIREETQEANVDTNKLSVGAAGKNSSPSSILAASSALKQQQTPKAPAPQVQICPPPPATAKVNSTKNATKLSDPLLWQYLFADDI